MCVVWERLVIVEEKIQLHSEREREERRESKYADIIYNQQSTIKSVLRWHVDIIYYSSTATNLPADGPKCVKYTVWQVLSWTYNFKRKSAPSQF